MTNRRSISYGWIVVGASVLLFIGAFGAQLSFGVLLKPLIDQFGWTRAATSGAMSVALAVSGLFGIFMGRMADKYSVRIVIITGITIGGIACFLLSSMSSLWQFYIYFGIGIGLCVGSCNAPVNATISKWFAEKRALALGIATAGIPIGQMILSPVITQIILIYSWRTAYIILAILVIMLAIPSVIIMKKAPPLFAHTKEQSEIKSVNEKSVKSLPSSELLANKRFPRTAPFWMLMITGFVTNIGFYFINAHIVAYAIDIGISATTAAIILTVTSIGGIAGSLLTWPITVKLGNRYALITMVAIEASTTFIFIWVRSPWLFYTVATFFGFSFVAAVLVCLTMVPQLFGIKSVGTITGLFLFAASAGGVVGPLFAGYIFDVTKSYNIAFLVIALLLIIGVFALQLLRPRHVK